MKDGYLLVVVNPFKGTYSAVDVAARFAAAASAESVDVRIIPGSDGGDGLLDTLRWAGVVRRTTSYEVHAVTREAITVAVGWIDDGTAVIESSAVIGLRLTAKLDRNPMEVSTRGLGELIWSVIRDGASTVYVGLGGSASTDGGLGLGEAFGFVPLDGAGKLLPAVGASLPRLHTFKGGTVPGRQIVALVDVNNPLTGPRGARVYARQKGADAEQEELFDRGLQRLVTVLGPTYAELATRPGAGAAGGLGFGVLAFAGGGLVQGAPWVLEQVHFEDLLRGTRGVVTAEGRFDATSLEGKLTGEVMGRALAAGVPTALVSPRATGVPDGVMEETGGGWWDGVEIEARARRVLRRLVRLPED